MGSKGHLSVAGTAEAGLGAVPHATPATNLPPQLTSFVGREEEITTATALLDDARLLTLTGSGGCGKTRLAQQVAARRITSYPDGVCWVDLAALAHSELVPGTVANALGLQEVPLQSHEQRLAEALRDKTLLIVLDNCEHLIATCAALVHKLLRECRSLHVLATSREPLGIEGEAAWRVPSMSLPEINAVADADELERYDAIQLFADRALKARPNFRLSNDNIEAVAEICRRLDGIPLAIELAAARTRLLSVEQIADGLADRFRLLTGGARTAVPRHQALVASVEWSYRLLNDKEKTLLRRLAVFSGSFTLDAAEGICTDEVISRAEILDLLAALIDKSLLLTEETTHAVRYRILETIRQYAGDKLIDCGEMPELRDRHVDHYVDVAEAARAQLEEGPDLLAALAEIDHEHGNLRAALEWAATSGGDRGARIARGMWGYWYARALLSEGSQRCQTAASTPGCSPEWKARALGAGAVLASTALDAEGAIAVGKEAWAIAEATDDPDAQIEASYALGSALFNIDPVRARPPLERVATLAEQFHAPFWAMRAAYGLGVAAVNSGELGTGRRLLEESMRISETNGIRLARLLILYWIGAAALEAGDLDDASSFSEQAITEAKEVRNVQFECLALGVRALAQIERGEHAGAEATLVEARLLLVGHPHPVVAAMLPYGDQMLALARGKGADTLDVALPFFDAIGARWISAWLYALRSEFRCANGDIDGAAESAEVAIERARASGSASCIARALRAQAKVSRARGDLDDAEALHHEALRNAVQAGAKIDIVEALEAIGGLAAKTQSYEEGARLLAAADARRAELGAVRFAPDDADYQRAAKLLRDNLDAGTFTRVWGDGEAMTLETAVSYAERGRGERKRPSSGWKSLTPVEIDVVRLVAEGLTNPQIAQRLFIAPGTVKNHLSHVFAKLGITTRAELAAEAARREL